MSGDRMRRPSARETEAKSRQRPSRESFSKVRVRFESNGEECVGSLYRPDGATNPPVVVMAPSLGSERTFGYPKVAERLAERDYAVLLFDYRNFGDSEGTPENLVSPSRHVADWREAVATVRDFEGIDGSRVVLWGYSFGGGHALTVAAEDPRIAAVVATAPFVDGRTWLKSNSLTYTLKATAAGVRDKLQSLVDGPHTVPIVGDPDQFAVLNQPGAKAGLYGFVPDGSGWKNACPARVFLSLPFYRPITSADDVRCPTLLVGGTDDDVVPVSNVESAADAVPNARFVRLPTDHFGYFDGPTFEETVGLQLTFLDAVVD